MTIVHPEAFSGLWAPIWEGIRIHGLNVDVTTPDHLLVGEMLTRLAALWVLLRLLYSRNAVQRPVFVVKRVSGTHSDHEAAASDIPLILPDSLVCSNLARYHIACAHAI